MKQYHFITGLPRSGSTLLSAILNQNPDFHSSISDPLAAILRATVNEATGNPGFKSECPPERVKDMCVGVTDGYYKSVNKPVIFNTNRAWGNLLPISSSVFPNSKYIACVRDLGWVIDSFETLVRKNSFTLNSLFTREEMGSVYSRAKGLLAENRVVGQAYNSLKQALSSEYRNLYMIVEYEDLCADPEKTMDRVYTFLNLPKFNHDFNNVESSFDEYDSEIGIKGLHNTRKKVQLIKRETVLPPDIWQSVKNWEFWRDPNWFKTMIVNQTPAKSPQPEPVVAKSVATTNVTSDKQKPSTKVNPNTILSVSSFLNNK